MSTMELTPEQEKIREACVDAALPIFGAADPRYTRHGIVVMLSLTNPRLRPLADAGFALCPCGPHRTIVEVGRGED